MTMSYRKLVLPFFALVFLATPIICQDILVYQESIEDESKLPTKKREPVENKALCGEDEFYYPGDQESDWICDCKPSYLYVPDKDKCYPAYRQGACKNGEYLVLPSGSFTPICQRNPCRNNSAMFENKCVRFGDPCAGKDTRRRYGVDEITLKVNCLPVPEKQRNPNLTFTATRFDEVPEIKYCYLGCKRFQNGDCVLKV